MDQFFINFRRNSLDVYTAEYAIKLAKDVSDKNKNNTNTNAANKENNNKYKIDTLEQKSAFHIKVIRKEI